MKSILIFAAALVVFSCSKNSNSPEENGIEQITLKVTVHNTQDDPVTEGWVRILADAGEKPHWLDQGWTTVEKDELQALDDNGESRFVFGYWEIDPAKKYVNLKNVKIFDLQNTLIKEDTTARKIYSGEIKVFDYIIE
ncbi:hypothetical protein ACFL4T_10780 [candidate division KSB1 bacterium]